MRYFTLLAIVFALPAPFQAQAQACSAGNQQASTINFFNHLAEPVDLYWLDFNCVETYYGTVTPGGSYQQPTYDGHEWVLRNPVGDEVLRVSGVGGETVSAVIGEAAFEPPTSPLDFDYRPAEGDFEPIVGAEGCTVEDVTPDLALDPFYKRYCDYEGVLIVGSSQVPDAAFHAAWNIIANMLQNQPEVLASFQEVGLKMGIVAEEEGITLLPEYAFLRDDPVTNWDERARGLGGNSYVPLGSGAEENLLCYTSDPYLGESIFLHEFAHTLKDAGIALVDPRFNAALQLAYDHAMATGLWENTYAITTLEEYWAEGVQSYFNTNLEVIPSNGIHNDINTRAELASYDPDLYAIIDLIFGGLEWTPGCPE